MNKARKLIGGGGAVKILGVNLKCNITDNTIFIYNHANMDGGALYVADTAIANVSDSNFSKNVAYSAGGAVAILVKNYLILSLLYLNDYLNRDICQMAIQHIMYHFTIVHSMRMWLYHIEEEVPFMAVDLEQIFMCMAVLIPKIDVSMAQEVSLDCIMDLIWK